MIKTAKYFLYGIKYVLKRAILKEKNPFIAGLVVGEICNLNCKHCNVSNISSKNDLKYNEIITGLKTLYKKGIRLLAITGGEPFLWRDGEYNIESIIKKAREMGFLIISLYTNGTISLNTSADDLFVSIDGLKDSGSKLRGDVYDSVIDNIKNSKHNNIIINSTINNKNKDEIELLCQYLSKINNIKGVFFYFHTPYYGIDELFIPFEERKQIILKLIELKKKYNILNSTAALWDVYYDRWERPSDLCLVYANNRLYKCCRSVGKDDVCKECGYLGYPEVINITKLKVSAILSALNYLPKKNR
ncbi:radical SAM protein [bacterium]|nr:radical SAM protein [bacterium]